MSTQLFSPIERRALHEDLADAMRDQIVEGRMKPGEKVSERDMCEIYSVSRTPVREAIKILATEGLVQLTPNRGAFVTEITLSELEEIFPLLGALEGLAGELACQKLTQSDLKLLTQLQSQMERHHKEDDLKGYFQVNQQAHQLIVQGAQNELLAQMHQNLSARAKRVRFIVNISRKRWTAAVKEHRAILRAFKARDAKVVRSLMEQHIANKFVSLKTNWAAA